MATKPAKIQHTCNLIGVDVLGKPAKLASEVKYFKDARDYFRVVLNESSVTVTTPKGVYKLEKHPVLNSYQGECAGIKTHISLKKIVGAIQYWSAPTKK